LLALAFGDKIHGLATVAATVDVARKDDWINLVKEIYQHALLDDVVNECLDALGMGDVDPCCCRFEKTLREPIQHAVINLKSPGRSRRCGKTVRNGMD
jgi:hypothetical protein